ncbi:helix-turn-helix domain-containing protein [Bacillus licheniformis]|uniref:helix-turn-helix transcriptional regulator n=1 Tax=Bacillus TaxID=1386 RepID=UPI00227EF1D0|nr:MULTISPECIES: helix-turn-helix domain-containing protein [Bacillus]MCY7861097.1 helix-turn-helix domain-containing protein [Bacillus haynesii]MCY8015574.1 helix-turn-helix domain-containing protein [Bacillus haynesii]MCY8291573.1 helix-turn-helix domain-containing protein [Bacillus haynesii]MCY8549197.1 helix-turn-helix domain-containing protein [Bacillus haynesii]MCY8745056.1 helix-turn-helix domain-containing protein [Bacillus licheniformis]
MPPKTYRYTTENTLAHYILIRKAEMVAEKGGMEVLIRDVENDLADFCDITRDSILRIKQGKQQPALAVALKIAEYFGVPVEEIFKLKDTEK